MKEDELDATNKIGVIVQELETSIWVALFLKVLTVMKTVMF